MLHLVKNTSPNSKMFFQFLPTEAKSVDRGNL
jgi:hypothetical protein